MSQLLIVQAVGLLSSPAFPGIVDIDRLLAKCPIQFFQSCQLLSAEKDPRIYVADNGISVQYYQNRR